jgi:hypothetical protein
MSPRKNWVLGHVFSVFRFFLSRGKDPHNFGTRIIAQLFYATIQRLRTSCFVSRTFHTDIVRLAQARAWQSTFTSVRQYQEKATTIKVSLGMLGCCLSLKLFSALLYCIRPVTKSRRIIEHSAGLRSTARNNCARNESTVYTLL